MATVAASQALQKGAVLRTKNYDYVIEKVLGAGTYGITYLATAGVTLADGTTATMKFAIKEHFMSSCYRDNDGKTVHVTEKGRTEVERTRTDFLGESERLQSLCMLSRSIVNVIESFRANGTAYYVMEYLDGGNPQPTDEAEAVDIVRQVAEALGKIHEAYMLHLDIKPANIVFKSTAAGGRYPVLIDFGVAKRFDHQGRPKTGLQAKGASKGYAPQEQFAEIKSFSPKYDIYALGGVLLYLLSGKNPPDAAKVSPAQTELKELIPDWVSKATRDTILQAMTPSHYERTPDVATFLRNLGPAPDPKQDRAATPPVKPEPKPRKAAKPEPVPEPAKPSPARPTPAVPRPEESPRPEAADDPNVIVAEIDHPRTPSPHGAGTPQPLSREPAPYRQPTKPAYNQPPNHRPPYAAAAASGGPKRKKRSAISAILPALISIVVAVLIGGGAFWYMNPGIFDKKVDQAILNQYERYCTACENAAYDDDIINRSQDLLDIRETDYRQMLEYEAAYKNEFPDQFNRSASFIDRLDAKLTEAAEKYNEPAFMPANHF